MAIVCNTRATLTSARVVTSYSVTTLTRNVLTTSPRHTTLIPYTITSCSTISSSRRCVTIRSTRASVIPPRVYTTPVRYYSTRPVYSTSRATLYSTSCSVSTRPGVAPPLTSFVTTTTTEISDVVVPTTTTETSGVTFSTTTTETSVPDTSVPDPTDTPEPNVGSNSTPETRQLPIGKIVGGVFGGIAVAFLLGLLVYHLCFKKAKVHDRRLGNLQRERSQLMSAMDAQLSPSEGSSGAFNSQMQESAARFANMDGLQDVRQQQHHPTSQESYNMTPRQPRRPYHPQQDGMVVAMVAPLSPPSIEQEHYDQSQRSTGLYLGRPEVQDSRL